MFWCRFGDGFLLGLVLIRFEIFCFSSSCFVLFAFFILMYVFSFCHLFVYRCLVLLFYRLVSFFFSCLRRCCCFCPFFIFVFLPVVAYCALLYLIVSQDTILTYTPYRSSHGNTTRTIAPSSLYARNGTVTEHLHSWDVQPIPPLPLYPHPRLPLPHRLLYLCLHFCVEYRIEVFDISNDRTSTMVYRIERVCFCPPSAHIPPTVRYLFFVLGARGKFRLTLSNIEYRVSDSHTHYYGGP